MKLGVLRALEIIGGKAESYAKALVAPKGPKGNMFPDRLQADIRNSITHKVDEKAQTVTIGSNMEIASYVELGTSKLYQPPPAWIQNAVKQGTHSGLDHWIFFDEKAQEFRVGLPLGPTKFLQPAVENHIDEYGDIIRTELG